MNRFLCLLSVSFLLCNCKNADHSNVEFNDAKWHFYSFATDLTAYRLGDTLNPLAISIRIIRSVKGGAANSIYFTAFYEDSSRVYRFRPFNLDGVAVTKTGIYTPILHTVQLDDLLDDSANLNYMLKMEELLIGKIRDNTESVNPWLLEESKKRGFIN